jgi:hypothetical protein
MEQQTLTVSARALIALNRVRGDRNIYAGTVPAAVVAKRRAVNKRARAARKLQRQVKRQHR